VDLRRQVREVRLLSDTTAELEVSLDQGHPRAAELLAEIFGAPAEAAEGARLVKVSAVYEKT